MPDVLYEVAVVCALIGIFGTAVATAIKVFPVLKQMSLTDEATKRGEKRDDLHDCQEQIAALRKEMADVNNTVTNLKIEMNGVLSAYRILEVDVEMRDPSSAALKQARAILSTAFAIAPSTEGKQ